MLFVYVGDEFPVFRQLGIPGIPDVVEDVVEILRKLFFKGLFVKNMDCVGGFRIGLHRLELLYRCPYDLLYLGDDAFLDAVVCKSLFDNGFQSYGLGIVVYVWLQESLELVHYEIDEFCISSVLCRLLAGSVLLKNPANGAEYLLVIGLALGNTTANAVVDLLDVVGLLVLFR